MYKGVVDVAERFAEVINAELKALVAAGADFIQLDEPARGNVSGEEMARLFNMATEGVNAKKLAFHICFGNRFGRSRFPRSYEPYFPGVLKARARSSCWSSRDGSCRSSSSGGSTATGASSAPASWT
jgi:5-methyltetrahydropteroyltriglutamate--homocysteine methyltransferase